VFPGEPKTELRKLEEFCSTKGLRLNIDKKKTFTFDLIESD
jgi:hypothetical protein